MEGIPKLLAPVLFASPVDEFMDISNPLAFAVLGFVALELDVAILLGKEFPLLLLSV